jgi:hypothetical protein
MPDIPVPEPLGYIGAFLVLAGLFLFIAGLGIINIEKLTIQPGRKTWGIGLLVTFVGILFLIPYIRTAMPTMPAKANTVTPTLTLAPTLTPIPCAFHSKPTTRQPFPPSGLIGSIKSPVHCEMGIISSRQSPITTEGVAEQIPNDTYLWLFVFAPDGKYYPQCNNIPATKAECTVNGEWSMRTYLGYSSNECKPYYLVLVTTNNDVTSFLLTTMNTWESRKSYPGLRRDELKPYGIKELYSVQLETGICPLMQTPTP